MRSRFAFVACLTLAQFALSASAQVSPPLLEHRFEGLVSDAFMSDDGSKLWTVEDGGRIRYRDSTLPAGAQWSYQATPLVVRDNLRRVHFIPHATTGWSVLANLIGWAVSQDGRVIKTIDGGVTWTVLGTQIVNPENTAEFEDLYDIHFIDAVTGWLVGLHGIWKSTNGGATWNQATLQDSFGAPLDMEHVELYAIDILQCAGNEPVIVACSEPGYVLRNVPGTAGTVFSLAWNIYDHCQDVAPNCGNGPMVPMMGQTYYGLVCRGEAKFEPWDIEFQRRCDPHLPPLLVMVGGIGVQLGIAFSSTDYGTSWTRECHECEVTPSLCAGNTDYNINTSNHGHYYRHQTFKSLYGVALFADGTGVGAGYNGQHVVRQANGVWVDRSQFNPYAMEVTDQASLFTFNGAASQRNAGSSITNGRALLVGQGGQTRGTTAAIATPPPPPGQPAENWTEENPAGWWRMSSTSFVSDNVGWRTGQLYHIARTLNGGRTWILEDLGPNGNEKEFIGIAMQPTATPASGGGVAVGTFHPSMSTNGITAFPDEPKIMRRTEPTPGTILWKEPLAVTYVSPAAAKFQSLYDVVWAGTIAADNVYWACGTGGLILRSVDSGATWTQFPPNSSFRDHIFTGLVALSVDEVLVVGQATSSQQAIVYRARYTATGTQLLVESNGGVNGLYDVAKQGTSIAAVGMNVVGGVRTGVVFTATYSNGSFSGLAALPAQPGATGCTVGDALGLIPPLNKVAITPNGDIWTGGECGRVWRRSGGAWVEAKSQTDGHVINMNATSGGFVYVTAFKQSLTGPGLVRWRPGIAPVE